MQMLGQAPYQSWVPCQLNHQFVPAFTVQSSNRQELQTSVKTGIDSLTFFLAK